jgi:Flp pilus assembly protein TadD
MLVGEIRRRKSMPRLTALMGAVALGALLSASAMADAPEQNGATMLQNLDTGIRDAQAKRAQHDLPGAIRVLSQLMLVAPDDVRVVAEYGKVLVQQGRARDAIDFLTRATQLEGRDWTLYSALGIAFDQTGEFNKARSAYDQALSIKPGEAVVLNNYAMSRMLAGDLALAKRLIAQAATGSRDDRVARNVKLIEGLPTPAIANASPARPSRSEPAATAPKPAAPVGIALQPPRPLTTPSVASAARSGVMIQPVPADPQAGKIGKPKPSTVAVAKPSTVAKRANSTAAATPVKIVKPAANAGIPALRLANDRP